ncbi:winged helix-turn-helix transcriptional regulator [bacterium]|nr:winged helix-turn-helix transcriptional regulator [bacterium]
MIKDVLRLISENRYASAREIAESLHISPDTLEDIFDRLERLGYAERLGSRADCGEKSCSGCSLKSFCDKKSSVKILRLTEKGRQAVKSE